MCKGKWSKEKCFEEAKKYKTKSEFRKKSSYACSVATKKGWIDEMNWLYTVKQLPNGYWNEENITKEAQKYTSISDFQKNSGGAFNAARKKGIINKFTWLKKIEKLPFNYWKNKEHCMEEGKKYHSRNEFRKANQSAYWAAHKYGYINEMNWFKNGREK